MFAAIFVPCFGLQALERPQPRPDEHERALALLDEAKRVSPGSSKVPSVVVEATAAALRAGVELGMSATQAQARCPRVSLFHRHAGCEASAQKVLLEAAGGMSPDFEDTAPGLVTFDLGSVGRFRTGRTTPPESTVREPSERRSGATPDRHQPPPDPAPLPLDRFPGFTDVRFGAGPSPDLAWLATQLTTPREPRCVLPDDPARLAERLAPLPLSLLHGRMEAAGVDASILTLWGLRTLGNLSALPREDVVQRLGPGAGEIHDLAAGKHRRLLRLVRPPADWTCTCDFDLPVVQSTPVLAVIDRFLHTLAARLLAAHRVAGVLRLVLSFETGARLARELRVAEPTTDQSVLHRILAAHLETAKLPAPVTAVTLEILPTDRVQVQNDLFQKGIPDPHRLMATLTQLESRMGPDRVGIPVRLPSRHPQGFRLAPFGDALADPKRLPNDPGPVFDAEMLCLDRPAVIRLLRPPWRAKVAVRHGRPAEIEAGWVKGPIVTCHGPFVTSGEWWDRARRWQRWEWDVTTPFERLRLIQHGQEEWYLEGIYD